MESLIQVFRMTEISAATRIKILIQLGTGINHQNGANLTEGLVYELVKALDPNHELLNDPWYQKEAGVITIEQYWNERNAKCETVNSEDIPF